MSLKVDQQMVRDINVASEGTDGTPFDTHGVVIPVVVPEGDISSLLAAYDNNNQYSPSAADARVIARVVLDALKAQQEG